MISIMEWGDNSAIYIMLAGYSGEKTTEQKVTTGRRSREVGT